jgi:hypothetical protein
MRELFGAGEQAVFENPDAKDKITLIERRLEYRHRRFCSRF